MRILGIMLAAALLVAAFPGGAAAAVDLNTASAAELAEAVHLSDAKCRAIVKYREKNGEFGSVWDVLRVPGVTFEDVERLKDKVAE